ncbi:MAG: hypothetical protein FWH22_04950 [Fibromonadales bacterium]|nr:hypothetical protein [Fibromonadales bacterium]
MNKLVKILAIVAFVASLVYAWPNGVEINGSYFGASTIVLSNSSSTDYSFRWEITCNDGSLRDGARTIRANDFHLTIAVDCKIASFRIPWHEPLR